jgi:hypothetical protein
MDTPAHTMLTRPVRRSIAVLAAIQYLTLVLALPFFHRHGPTPGAAARASLHRFLASGAAVSDRDTCPSCEWDLVAKAAAPPPVLWTRMERSVRLPNPPRAADPPASPAGLPSSRAPPFFLA